MRETILYIAMSLDGYIADERYSVDWIEGQEKNGGMPDTYAEFVRTVDTVVMGRRTYDQIVTELAPDRWPYGGLATHVLTRRPAARTDGVEFTDTDPCTLVERLRQEPGKAIWICGGAQIVRPLLRHGMIDVFHLAVVPVILGRGVRLFGETDRRIELTLTRTLNCNGITELIYVRRRP